jgi:hypothetical protein
MGHAAEKKIETLKEEAEEGRRESARVLRECEEREKEMVANEQVLMDKVSISVCVSVCVCTRIFWLLMNKC